jgi:hypothetical protein
MIVMQCLQTPLYHLVSISCACRCDLLSFTFIEQIILSHCKLDSSNLIGSLAVIMKLYYLPVACNLGNVILL